MIRPMRICVAASIAVFMTAAGCGGGTEANGNVAPRITSTPATSATVGVPYNYTVTADGMTPIGFVLESGPSGFSLHPTTGVVTWTPQDEGSVSIKIKATNLDGSDTQSFDVDVEGLTGPEFVTEPPTQATVGAQYAYDPEVVANGNVSWSVTAAPSDAQLRSSG